MISNIELRPTDRGSERKPGETVELVVRWAFRRKPVLEFQLFWRVESRMGEERMVVVTHRFTPALAEGQLVFQLVMPESPWSFSGKITSLHWGAEIVGDGMTARWDFTLSPGGREIVLHAPLST